MNIKSQKDFFSGLMFMGVGVAFAWGASNYTIGSGAVTGNDGAAVVNSGAVNQSINVRTLARPVISAAPCAIQLVTSVS